MKLGADDYLTKPFKIDELLEAVKVRLEKKDRISKEIDKFRLSISCMLPHEFRTPLSIIRGYAELLSNASDLRLSLDSVAKMASNIFPFLVFRHRRGT